MVPSVPRTRSETQTDVIDQRWRVQRCDYLPAAALVLIMTLAWLTRHSLGMADWGVSATALARGKYENIPLHLFAHGGIFHLLMNSLGLLEIGGLVTARLGGFAKGWLRFTAAFVLGGVSSMIAYLSFHPNGDLPMIGASGAIYALVGLLLGIRLIEELEPVELSNLHRAVADFVRNNMFLLLLLLVGGILAGIGRGVAWEAHLGGFFFGLCIGPWLLPLDD